MDRRQREQQAKKAAAIERAKQSEANRAGAGRKRQFEKVEASRKAARRNQEPVTRNQKRKPAKKRPVNGKRESPNSPPEPNWQNNGMSREEYRRSEREQREKRNVRKKGFKKVIFILLLLIVGLVLSVTVFFKTETIKVTGLSQYTKEQIEDASGIRTGDNLILMKKKAVAERISEKLPYTGEINIKKEFPSTVEIQVSDAKIESAVKSGGEYYILDGSGKVLKTVKSKKEVYKTVMEQAKIAEKKREELKKASEKKTGNTVKEEQPAADKKEAPEKSEKEQAQNTSEQQKTGEAEKSAEKKEDSEKQETVPEDYRGDVIIINGFDVKKAEPGHLIEIKDKEKFDEYGKILKILKKQGITDITGMDFSKRTDIVLIYDERIEIRLGTSVKLEQKLALGAKILREQNKVSREQKGVIDLTIPGKGYFSEGKIRVSKPEDEKAEETKDKDKEKKDSDSKEDGGETKTAEGTQQNPGGNPSDNPVKTAE